MLAVIGVILSAGGGSGVGGTEKRSKPGYAQSATDIYQMGQVLGARDALHMLPSDYTRHLKSFDSPFLAQFRAGYDNGYAMYEDG